MNFPDKLREIRKNKGYSQEQLAEKIGVSRQAITKWESGKGLPDVENMMILAEIFKTTLDELLCGSVKSDKVKKVYSSDTIYDIDCKKHFDINIGSASKIILSSGTDEKLNIKLSSETIENIDTVFKVKLDENKNRLDVNCLNRNKLSRYEAEDSLNVEIILPMGYVEHCELAASVKELVIKNLHIKRLEYDGAAEFVHISGSSGSIELTSKNDYDITVGEFSGRLDVNQWKAKSVVHVSGDSIPKITNKGRKCNVVYAKNGNIANAENGNIANAKNGNVANAENGNVKAYENPAETENELSVSGIFSELIVDLDFVTALAKKRNCRKITGITGVFRSKRTDRYGT